MPAFAHRLAWIVVLALAALGFAGRGHAADAPSEARQAWQLLDYIAVDYPAAVQDGQIVDAGEYAEMQEFTASVTSKLSSLPEVHGREQRLAAARNLETLVARRAAPADIAREAGALAADLLKTYRIEAAPAAAPDLVRARALYAQQCSACHGATGAGDGPAATGMDPPPIAFTDAARAAHRSPLSLYQVISQGLPGTAMASYAHLPNEDRWALAYFVGSLAYDERARGQGGALWSASEQARRAVPTLEALSAMTESDLGKTLAAEDARAITAYLRSRPGALAEASPTSSNESLALARQRLDGSVQAYRDGDRAQAGALALSAYLDGVEPVEPMIAARDRSLLRQIEAAMAGLRSKINAGASLSEVEAQAALASSLLDRSEQAVSASGSEAMTAFLGSFTILLREGVEALLIVIGMIAFLRKAERPEVLRYVHAGWVGALLAGVATWAVATYLVGISGANREITEGLSALFAAVVLLSVGIWMHQKSLAGRWQQYLHARMSAALTRRSALFLFLLAFVAVYREVFETILFFIAMWSEQNATAMLGGLLAGTVVLVAVAFWMLRVSRRLPIGRFFAISSVLIAILAVVLVGKGMVALQEAGWVAQALVAAPRVEWLGVYPSWQSLLAQLVVASIAVIGFYLNSRTSRAPARATQS